MIMRSVVKHIRNDFFDKKRLYYFFNSAEVRTLRKGDVVDIIKETENSFNEFLFDKTYFLIILSSSKVNKMKNLHNKYRRLTFPDWSGLVKAIFCLTPCSADLSAEQGVAIKFPRKSSSYSLFYINIINLQPMSSKS